MVKHEQRLSALGAARWRIAGTLTAAMMLIYFGFIALIAYDTAHWSSSRRGCSRGSMCAGQTRTTTPRSER